MLKITVKVIYLFIHINTFKKKLHLLESLLKYLHCILKMLLYIKTRSSQCSILGKFKINDKNMIEKI